MTERKITYCFEIFKWLFFKFNTLSTSTITKLEIAFIKVSILLIVKEIAKIITMTENIIKFSFNKIEKNARSGMT